MNVKHFVLLKKGRARTHFHALDSTETIVHTYYFLEPVYTFCHLFLVKNANDIN